MNKIRLKKKKINIITALRHAVFQHSSYKQIIKLVSAVQSLLASSEFFKKYILQPKREL